MADQTAADKRLQRGIAMYKQLRGKDVAEPLIELARSDRVGAARARYSLETCFGDVWSRPGLDPRSRSLLTLGMILALGLHEEFGNHLRIGLKNGLTPKELDEILLHCAPYLGLPRTAFASRVLREVLAEQDA